VSLRGQQSPDDPLHVAGDRCWPAPRRGLAARVNKPTLSPTLRCWSNCPGSGIRQALAIAWAADSRPCEAVQEQPATRAAYVLGMPVLTNVAALACRPFWRSASSFAGHRGALRVHAGLSAIHFRHSDGRQETVPFFRPRHAPILKECFFAPQLPELFRYVNAGAESGRGVTWGHFRPPKALCGNATRSASAAGSGRALNWSLRR